MRRRDHRQCRIDPASLIPHPASETGGFPPASIPRLAVDVTDPAAVRAVAMKLMTRPRQTITAEAYL